ncbi:IclR family transcriptional regulator [Rhodoferax sp. U11-2br]|uniref:IclR family transcriptional regulator n=1 Tax=Rhodoferax sp. U11-2br TaxID=2838878 RepID=UPI001BEBBDEF|nr:IclR family transcriptional regulator [Rhodoferax sp. U11-2br]MBT3069120.1 IclR family transcriptional regulator [Rhodoferax sp. U11-2br]
MNTTDTTTLQSDTKDAQKGNGTQTLLRGLALLECVAQGISDVKGIAAHLGTPRSTTHRMLNSLVAEGYLHHVPYGGYSLGFRLIYLGTKAQEQRPLGALARPFLEELAAMTGDTVHLGTQEGNRVFYLDKISGTKGLEMRSRIGNRMPLASTGVGKALMLGLVPEAWQALYNEAVAEKVAAGEPVLLSPWPQFQEDMLSYRAQGWVMDLEENEIGIRCVGAPVRDVSGEVVAAVSVASAAPYITRERMLALGPTVRNVAHKISEQLGLGTNRHA